MKKSKRSKASKQKDGVDMISNLPDDVLQLILSFIPSTEEVIRTSVLSRRWRYLWTSIPFIDIDYTRRLDSLKELDCNKFKEFVDWVLANKSLNLDSFRLWCGKYYSMSTIMQWIHAVVMRKVKVLDLMFCPKESSEKVELPQCLVTCGSLEVLKMCLIYSPLSLPTLTEFPALRVLELKEVDLYDDDIVNYFLKSCPLLEDLSLIDCSAGDLVISSEKLKSLRINGSAYWWNCNTLEICCLKLEFFKLTGFIDIHMLINSHLCSIKKAVIRLKEELDFDLFATIPHVEFLSINLGYVTECYNPQVDAPISLPNLKTLELTVDYEDVLIPFLKCFPDLESLHLIIPKGLYHVDTRNLAKVATKRILTRRLKKVEFVEYDGEKEKQVIVRALLKHGKALEEIVFNWGDEAWFHVRSKQVMNQVSKFPKTSSEVKLRAVIKPT